MNGRRAAMLTTCAAMMAVPTAIAAPAEAATGCVTQREFAKVKKGMAKAKVHRVFGTKGKRDAIARSGGYTSEVRSYRSCAAYGAVAVSFLNGRLAAKSAVF